MRINVLTLFLFLSFTKLSIATQLSSPLDIDIVRVGNHSEAICEVGGVWLGLVQRVVKLEALHQGRREDEEAVRGEAHPHADPPPQAEGEPACLTSLSSPASVVFDNFDTRTHTFVHGIGPILTV